MTRPWMASALALAACAALAIPGRAFAQSPPPTTSKAGELVPFWLVRPDYPPIARAARVQGTVIVAVTVDPDGRVTSATIERDIPLLSRGALAAAREGGFLCRGCTGSMNYRLTCVFELVDVVDMERARAEISSESATMHMLVDIPILEVTNSRAT